MLYILISIYLSFSNAFRSHPVHHRWGAMCLIYNVDLFGFFKKCSILIIRKQNKKSHLNNSLAFAGSLLRWELGMEMVFRFGHQKRGFLLIAYPLLRSQENRKIRISNAETHAVYICQHTRIPKYDTRGCITIHPMSIYYYLF